MASFLVTMIDEFMDVLPNMLSIFFFSLSQTHHEHIHSSLSMSGMSIVGARLSSAIFSPNTC